MNDNGEFDRLEMTLREFQPRRPRPLPALAGPTRRWPRILATAAALLLVAAVLFFRTLRPFPPPHADEPVNVQVTPSEAIPEAGSAALGRFTALAIAHPEQFDAALASESRALLPDLDAPGGALQQLAKD